MKHKTIQVKKAGDDFYVVGVGVSAGGLGILSLFFDGIPADTNMAFVVIQHLSEKPKSMLTEILSRKTNLPLSEITGNTPLLPGHIYVAPAHRSVTISKNTLNLSRRSPKKENFLPVNIFFSTLAREKKERAIGIILSGTGKDGAEGLRAILDGGGITFAESPKDTVRKGMPKNAVASGTVMHILSPKKIGAKLSEIILSPPLSTAMKAGYATLPVNMQAYDEMKETAKDRTKKLREMNALLMREVLERKRLEKNLYERNAELEEAARQKNEFLAILAHELRNPLAPIIASVEAMKIRGTDDPETKRVFEIIGRQAEQMTRLLKNLLDTSKTIYEKIILSPEYVDVREIIHRAAQAASFFVAKRGHTLTLVLPDEPKYLVVDPIHIEQILTNLIFNAAKYTNPGGKIEIILSAQGARDDEKLCIRVKDNGLGIAPDLQPKIFDLFVQPEGVLKKTKGGLGVGLFLVRRLAELHGGTITAHSEGRDKGSTFTVCLPVKNNLSPAKETGTSVADINKNPAQKRILVADDNQDAADSLGKILSYLGCVVEIVYNGKEAIQKAKETPPDMAFIDIAMPKMDGYEVAKKMKKEPSLSQTKLIALTGFGQKEDREKALRAGFDFHYVKPITLATLKEIIGG